MYRFFSWCQTLLPWDVQLTAADICNFSLISTPQYSLEHPDSPVFTDFAILKQYCYSCCSQHTDLGKSGVLTLLFLFNNPLNVSSAVFSFTGSVLLKLALDPTFLIFFLRQNNWRLHMTKSDACFIKCHLYKPGFAPKNVNFNIRFCYPCWCQSRFASMGFCCHVFCWSCPSFLQMSVLQRLQDNSGEMEFKWS